MALIGGGGGGGGKWRVYFLIIRTVSSGDRSGVSCHAVYIRL